MRFYYSRGPPFAVVLAFRRTCSARFAFVVEHVLTERVQLGFIELGREIGIRLIFDVVETCTESWGRNMMSNSFFVRPYTS